MNQKVINIVLALGIVIALFLQLKGSGKKVDTVQAAAASTSSVKLGYVDLDSVQEKYLLYKEQMDLFEKNYFDAWLAEDVKNELRNELRKRWMNETHGQCIFVSATEKQNIENLRTIILDKVKDISNIF